MFSLRTPTDQPIIVRDEETTTSTTTSTTSVSSTVSETPVRRRLRNPRVRRCLFPDADVDKPTRKRKRC
jgi:hypothetical protein